MTGPVRAARLVFGVAGIYGLIVLVPLFFAEPWLVPPPSRPEDYYGFLGAAAAMQLVYLAIASDPIRYRPLMPIGVLAKSSFFATMLLLWTSGRTGDPGMVLATIDLGLGIGFAVVWRLTRS